MAVILDDEIAAISMAIIASENENDKKPRKFRIHPLNKRRTEHNIILNFFDELRKDEMKFRNYTRMQSKTFEKLLQLIENRIEKIDTNLSLCSFNLKL